MCSKVTLIPLHWLCHQLNTQLGSFISVCFWFLNIHMIPKLKQIQSIHKKCIFKQVKLSFLSPPACISLPNHRKCFFFLSQPSTKKKKIQSILICSTTFYKVLQTPSSEYSITAWRGNTGLDFCEPLVTIFSSTDRYSLFFQACFCLRTPYLIHS